MNPIQKELSDYIDSLDMPAFFEKLDDLGLSDAIVNTLKKEFIAGKADENFYDRCKVFVGTLALQKSHLFQNQKWISDTPDLIEYVLPRTQLLEVLHKKIYENPNKALLLQAYGGFGKTILAKLYAQKYENDYENMVWIEFDENITQSFLPLYDKIPHDPNDKGDTEQKLKYIWDYLKKKPLNAQKLIIINNVDTVADFRKLTNEFRNTNWKILLTGRAVQHESIPVFELPKINFWEAYTLFTHFYTKEKDLDRELLIEIFDKVAYHTQIIELIAKQTQYNSSLGLKATFELIENNRLFRIENERKITIEKDGQSQKSTIKDYIAVLFDLKKLDTTELFILNFLAWLPPFSFPATLLHDIYVELFEEEQRAEQGRILDDTLNELYEKASWVVRNAKQEFYLHPLIAELLRENKASFEEEAPKYIQINRNLLEYYRNRLELILWANCQKHIVTLLQNSEKIDGFLALVSIYLNLGMKTEANTYLKKINSQQLNPEQQGGYYNKLGRIQDNSNIALSYYQKALAIEPLKELKACILNNIALCYENQKDYEKAIQFYKESIALMADRDTLGQIYINLAGLYYRNKNYSEMNQCLDKAAELIKVVNEYLANLYYWRALYYDAQKDYLKAKEWIDKSVAIYEEFYKEIPNQPHYQTARVRKKMIEAKL